jgi:hypothetical protein
LRFAFEVTFLSSGLPPLLSPWHQAQDSMPLSPKYRSFGLFEACGLWQLAQVKSRPSRFGSLS